MIRLLTTLLALLSLLALTETEPADEPVLQPYDDDEIDAIFERLEHGDEEQKEGDDKS